MSVLVCKTQQLSCAGCSIVSVPTCYAVCPHGVLCCGRENAAGGSATVCDATSLSVLYMTLLECSCFSHELSRCSVWLEPLLVGVVWTSGFGSMCKYVGDQLLGCILMYTGRAHKSAMCNCTGCCTSHGCVCRFGPKTFSLP